MKSLNRNRKGYKHTPIGWIPEDWEVKSLGDVCDKFLNGGTPSTIIKDYWQGEIPWVTGADISGQKIAKVRRYINENAITNSSTNLIPKGWLLIVTRTGVGKLVVAPYNVAISQDITGVKVKNSMSVDFLFRYLDYQSINLSLLNQGTSINGITRATLISFPVPFPLLPEQTIINKVLATWDKAIENVQKLITTKQQLKTGLMQQLLTGNKRLPGFDSEWKEIDFGKIFEFIRTESFSRDDLTYSNNEGKVAYIHYGDIHATFENQILNVSNETLPFLKNSELPNKSFSYLLDGDLVIADASEDYEGVAECIELSNINGRQIIGGLHTIVARDKSSLTVPGFRAYIFKNPVISLRLKKIAVGTSVYSVSKSELSKLKIPLPTIEEQTIIARIFSDIDKEINILKSELELYRQQKKGLMQVLLTGAVRVKL